MTRPTTRLDSGAQNPAGQRRLLAAVAALVAIHLVVAGFVAAGRWEPSLYGAAVEGIPWLVAMGLVVTGRATPSLPLVLAVGVLMRLVCLPLEPLFSSDMYRYVWEGRVQAAGFSPYLHVPADPALAALRDDIWSHVNRANYATTIYPPVAQAFFFAVTRVSETVTAMKLAMVGCEAVAMWAVARLLAALRKPATFLTIYLWCPITAWEVAGNGHVDALLAAFVALALLAAHGRRDALAGLALAAAVLTKFIPLVLAPALWRRWDWKLPLACAALVVLAYVPHLATAGTSVIGFMPTYTYEEGMQTGRAFWLIRMFWLIGIEPPLPLYLGFVALIAGVLGVAAAFLAPREPRPAWDYTLALAAFTMLAVSPAFPWYFMWLMVILVIRPYWPLFYLAAASPLLYLDYGRVFPAYVAAVYGVTALLCAADAVWQWTSQGADGALRRNAP